MGMKKFLAVGIILLFVGTCILSLISSCRAKSDEYYFEDVNVFVIGRCRSIFSAPHRIILLSIGKLREFGIDITDKPLERLYIFVNNGTKPGFSIGPTNDSIHIRNLTGIILWGSLIQYGARKIPPFIFVCCHAEQVWIREPGWEPHKNPMISNR
jgi:hypothetical protein